MILLSMKISLFILALVVAGIGLSLKMKQIIEDIFPVIRDIDDQLDDFEEYDIY